MAASCGAHVDANANHGSGRAFPGDGPAYVGNTFTDVLNAYLNYNSALPISLHLGKRVPHLPQARLGAAAVVLANYTLERCGFDANYFHTGRACTWVEPFAEVGRTAYIFTDGSAYTQLLGARAPGGVHAPVAFNQANPQTRNRQAWVGATLLHI